MLAYVHACVCVRAHACMNLGEYAHMCVSVPHTYMHTSTGFALSHEE